MRVTILAPLCFALLAGHARPRLHAQVVRGGLLETDEVIASMSAVGPMPARWFVNARSSVIQSRPAIVTRERAGPFRRILDDPLVENRGWVLVRSVRGGQPRDLFALLDDQIESRGDALLVIASADGGLTWQLRGELRKPYRAARVTAAQLDRGGRGRITLALDDAEGAPVRTGKYVFETTDGGVTFREI